MYYLPFFGKTDKNCRFYVGKTDKTVLTCTEKYQLCVRENIYFC